MKKGIIMLNYFTIIILLSVTLFSACHKKKEAKTASISAQASGLNPPSSEDQNKIQEIKKAIIDIETDMTNTGSLYDVDSMKIDNGILSVFVNYAGCKSHVFELYSNGMYAKSLPPQLSLCLRHIGNDGCRKLMTEVLKFNVENLKYPGKSTVVLKLGDQRVNYTSK